MPHWAGERFVRLRLGFAGLAPFVLRGKQLAKQLKAGASCGRSDAKHDGPGNRGRTRGKHLDEHTWFSPTANGCRHTVRKH